MEYDACTNNPRVKLGSLNKYVVIYLTIVIYFYQESDVGNQQDVLSYAYSLVVFHIFIANILFN